MAGESASGAATTMEERQEDKAVRSPQDDSEEMSAW